MKKTILTIIVLSSSIMASEHIWCDGYYQDVVRKVDNMQTHGSNLSKMAENKLYKELKSDTSQCISYCGGNKFSFCNKVAKDIESH